MKCGGTWPGAVALAAGLACSAESDEAPSEAAVASAASTTPSTPAPTASAAPSAMAASVSTSTDGTGGAAPASDPAAAAGSGPEPTAAGAGGQSQAAMLDDDADGVLSGEDCNDDDPLAYPGALERCNGADDDCDGQPDNDCFIVPEVDRGEYDGHEYAAYRGSKLPHADAERGCQLLGMELVRVDDADENSWLVDFAFNQGNRDNSCETPCTWHCGDNNRCDQAQIWIGGNDKAEEGTWTWRIGGDVFFTGLGKEGITTDGMFTNWGQAGGGPDELQPNNEENNETVDTWEDCLVLRTNGKWFDLGCQNRRGWFVCEQTQ